MTPRVAEQAALLRRLAELDRHYSILDAPMVRLLAQLDFALLARVLAASPSTARRGGPDPAQVAALAAFARRHGRTWKAALRLAWETGADEREPEAAYLRQVRNQYGPRWLARYQLPEESRP